MLDQIQELINQLEEFLSTKEGFSTEKTAKGAILTVVSPNGSSVQYDGYELLLYMLASRKLGHEIQLNINKDAEGKELFAVQSAANFNLNEFILAENSKTLVYADDVHAVVLSSQVAESAFPYCVSTFFRNGSWLRYDLTMPELLYAAVNKLPLEVQEDGSFAYTKLRDLTKKLRAELDA